MKRLLLTILLIIVIYFAGKMLLSLIQTYTNGASLIMSGVSQTELRNTVINHYNTILSDKDTVSTDAEVDLRTEHINTDNKLDVIATAHTDASCGSGGCITTIFLQNEFQEFVPISFAYAIKHIEVLGSVTNDMHDLMLNNDKRSKLIWNGSTYTFNEIYESNI